MKKFFKIFIVSLIISLSIATISMASNKKVISSVSVTDIEAPYSSSATLDTSGKVPKDSFYKITDIKWNLPEVSSSGYYEVIVTLKSYVGYSFSDTTTGTINGKSIIAKELLEEDEIKITYAFNKKVTDAGVVGGSTSTLRYRISVYCDKDKGAITPLIARPLKDSNQTMTIVPKDGYRIKDVKVDGESVGAVSEYTFKKIDENHTIRAYFEEIEVEEEAPNMQTKPLLSILFAIFGIN